MSTLNISGGITQNERTPRGLQPGYFRLDDRSIQDLLVEAHEYARLLHYYGPDNRPDGDWTCFWKSDPTILLATIAALNTDEIRRQYEAIDLEFGRMLQRYQDSEDDSCTEDPTDDYYRRLLRYLRDMAWQLEQFYRDLFNAGLPLGKELLNLIKRDNALDIDELNGALHRLIQLHKAGDDRLHFSVYEFAFVTAAPASQDNHWGVYDRVIFEQIQVSGTLDRVLLREIFIIFYKTLVLLKSRAQRDFDANFNAEKQVHPPHIALFLAFLRLFRHAQDSLNDLVLRHLDFYYEQVLGLRRRPESPDEAYLVFELAKGIDAFLVEKGAELLAGKDKNGKPLAFEAVEDWVVRDGKVMDLKNTYIDPESGRITANPDVHKKYLAGAELPNEKAGRWRTMGDDPELPVGEVGFAIASPQLILKEGRRVVDVVMEVKEGLPEPPELTFADLQGKEYFKAFLSSETDWIELKYDNTITAGGAAPATLDQGSFNILFDESNSRITIRVVLEKDDPPVITPGKDLAKKANFTTPWPILKLVVNPELPLDNDPHTLGMAKVYEVLRQLIISEITITVDVTGIRENLIIQSDQGVFDGTQKVYPFGPAPEMDNNFYVGSTEVFQKALSKLEVRFEWIDAPENFDLHYKEYTYVGVTVPKPFVRVDFIDRAIAPPAKQVVKLGAQSKNVIEGKVTDIENKALKDITVEIIPVGGGVPLGTDTTDENGIYSIDTHTVDIPTTATIRFIPPPPDPKPKTEISSQGTSEEKYYEKLENVADPTAENPELKSKIIVDSFASINAILFPLNRKFGDYKDTVTVKVIDIYGGEPAPEVTIEGFKFNDEKKEFERSDADAPIPESITLKGIENYNFFNTPLPIFNFSELEIVLEPKESILPPSGSFPASNIIGGTVTSAEKNVDGRAKLIQGALIKVEEDGQTIKAFSNGFGRYKIPVKNEDSVLTFYPNVYEHLIVIRSPLKTTAKLPENIDATLLSPQQVEEVFSDGELSATIKDYRGNALEDVIVTKLQDDNRTYSDKGIRILENSSNTDGLYKIEISDLKNHTKTRNTLKFSRPAMLNFEDIILDVDDYSDIELMMFPKTGIEQLGDLLSTENLDIIIHIYNYNGDKVSLDPKVIKESDTNHARSTGNPGEYTITLSALDARLNLILAPYEDLLNIQVTKSIIYFILKPKNSIVIGHKTITGKILDAKGAALSNINIILEGEIPTGTNETTFLKYESKSNSTNGSISLTRLDTVLKKKLTFTDASGYTTEIRDLTGGSINAILSTQIKKYRAAKDSLSGVIKNFKGEVIEGVEVIGHSFPNLPGSPGFTKTYSKADGIYELSAFTSKYIIFYHVNYQMLIVEVEQGCIHLNVRLKPKPVYGITSGVVKDIFGDEIPGANVALNYSIQLMETLPDGGWIRYFYRIGHTVVDKTASNGGYNSVKIPLVDHTWEFNLATLTFSFEKYESVSVDDSADDSAAADGFTRSDLKIVLPFKRLNFVNLINPASGSSTGGTMNPLIPVTVNAFNLKRDTRTQFFDKYSPTLKRGFIRLTLASDDFRHQAYQNVLTLLTIYAASPADDKPFDLIGYTAPAGNPPPPMPNPPYTPSTNGISLDYTSTQKIITQNDDIDQYFHLLSFNGHRQVEILKEEPSGKKTPNSIQWMYAYPADDTLEINTGYAPGNLFIGLSELTPGGTLSLLVQVADGTEFDPDKLPPTIRWSYMGADNTWLPFSAGEVLLDGTRGLTRSGIIQFTVPTKVVRENTLLDPRYFWLRAAAMENDTAGENNTPPVTSSKALSDIVDIRAQAVQVRFKNQNNDLSHLAAPLPAGSISKLALSRTEVKKLEQPLASFGGRLPETANLEFYTRISERLRHKDRAVLTWDYEHLLLERYTDIATAKCLPHVRYRPAEAASETAPGFVTVAVIPQLRKRNGERWPEPRFSKGDLDDMRDYLAARTNLFVATDDFLQVVNPHYQKVDIHVEVDFREKVDAEFHTEKLRKELEEYLSPWLANPAAMPRFGRTLQYSAILLFIETRDYVDTVDLEKFTISMLEVDVAGQSVKGSDGEDIIQFISPTEEIVPSTARSILVAGKIIAKAEAASGETDTSPISAPSSGTTPVTGGVAEPQAADDAVQLALEKTASAPPKPVAGTTAQANKANPVKPKPAAKPKAGPKQTTQLKQAPKAEAEPKAPPPATKPTTKQKAQSKLKPEPKTPPTAAKPSKKPPKPKTK